MTEPCDICEKNPASKEAIVLTSDPIVPLEICVICWLKHQDDLWDIRVIQNDEDLSEVLKYYDEEENELRS